MENTITPCGSLWYFEFYTVLEITVSAGFPMVKITGFNQKITCRFQSEFRRRVETLLYICIDAKSEFTSTVDPRIGC